MDRKEESKEEICLLAEEAVALQNELHDTVEGLPRGSDRIVGLAQRTAAAFERLQALRRELKGLG